MRSHLGSGRGQNPLSTWVLTKKIMSASHGDMCAPPTTAPATASLPVSGQPAVVSSHMPPPRPPIVAPTTLPSETPSANPASHPGGKKKARKTRRTYSLQAPRCACRSKTAGLGLSLLLTCATLYTGQTNAHSPSPLHL